MSTPTAFEEGRGPMGPVSGYTTAFSLLECRSTDLPDVRGPGYSEWLRDLADTLCEHSTAIRGDKRFRKHLLLAVRAPHRMPPIEVLRQHGFLEALAARSQRRTSGNAGG